MNKNQSLNQTRLRRRQRVRAKISGTAARPRLSVFRSVAHISAQLIDDGKRVTLASAHDREVKAKGTKTEVAVAVGTLLGEKAIKAGVKTAVFDKGPYKFHGRVKALADAARQAGLVI